MGGNGYYESVKVIKVEVVGRNMVLKRDRIEDNSLAGCD